MNEKEWKYCSEILAQTKKSRGVQDEESFIIDNCPHPKWQKIDVFEKLEAHLKEILKGVSTNIENIDIYIEFRQENQKKTKNARLIKEYLISRKNLLDSLLHRIRLFRDINQERQSWQPQPIPNSDL